MERPRLRSGRHIKEAHMQAKREKVPELAKQRPGTRRRRSNDRHPLGRRSRAGRKTGRPSFGGLQKKRWTANTFGPRNIGRPVFGKPLNHFVIFLRREGLSFTNSRKEASISGAMASDGRFFQVSSPAESVRKHQEVLSEFSFHAPLIVGFNQRFNWKHPIRVKRGKFPIVSA